MIVNVLVKILYIYFQATGCTVKSGVRADIGQTVESLTLQYDLRRISAVGEHGLGVGDGQIRRGKT